MKQSFVKIFIGVLTLFCHWNYSHAQGLCGTKVTPEYIQFLINYKQAAQNQRLIIPQINKTINITAWIILDKNKKPSQDSADIIDAVARLDSFFRPMGVSFSVCKINYIENWQYAAWVDTTHEDQAKVLYYQPNTINIYFPDSIISPTEAGGYAPLPPSDDFMVISDLGAMPHEMGHFFGLVHTFQSPGSEFVDGSNCTTAGDIICDTEADPDDTGQNVDINCNYTGPPQRDPHGDFYEPPTDNIMSYYGKCRCRFTPQQYLLMAQMYVSFRGNLW